MAAASSEVTVTVSSQYHVVVVSLDLGSGLASIAVRHGGKEIYYVSPRPLGEAVAKVEELAADLVKLAHEAAEVARRVLRS